MITTRDILLNITIHGEQSNQNDQPIYNKEPLTLDDFIIIKKKPSTRKKSVYVSKLKHKHNNQLVIKLYPWHAIYGVVTSEFNREDITDNNLIAPSIEQWYRQLLVDPNEVERLTGTIDVSSKRTYYKNKLKNLNLPVLSLDTIKDVVGYNFGKKLSNNTLEFQRRCKYKPVGFVHDNQVVSVYNSRKLYGQLYQQQILNDEESLSTFKMLHDLCINRDRRYPVVICTPFAKGDVNKLTIYNLKSEYPSCKLLIEMLINYPNLENCEWNVMES